MNRTLILVLLFWTVSTFSIYCGIDIFFDVDDSIQKGYILIKYSNPLIKYSPSFMLISAGIGCLLFPIIAAKTQIALGSEYYEGTKRAKAKSNFVAITIFLPTLIFILSTYYYSNMSLKNIPFLLMSGFFTYTYISSIFTLLFSDNDE